MRNFVLLKWQWQLAIDIGLDNNELEKSKFDDQKKCPGKA